MTSITCRGAKLAIRNLPRDFNEWVRTLPSSRWDQMAGAWVCDATPVSAYRCMTEVDAVEADQYVRDLAKGFMARKHSAQWNSVGPALEQPPIRKHDSWRHQTGAYHFANEMHASLLWMGMGCIAGDAKILVNRASISRTMTLREAYRRFNRMERHGSDWTAPWHCRALKGKFFGQHRIKAIIHTGTRPVVKVTLSNGKSIRCTPDHEIAGPNDTWTRADNLTVGASVLTNGKQVVACEHCGKEREFYQKEVNRGRKFCGQACFHASRRGTGKGFVDSDGYRRLQRPDHPRANPAGQVYEHIVVMEQALGRSIGTDEHIHHRNRIRHDNRVENLEVVSPGEHLKRHDGFARVDGGRTINGGKVCFVPKIAAVVSVESDGESDVYDIVMEEPYRNFVADGIVVHNCGKSKIAVDLIVNRNAQLTLILCPVSVLGVWRREVDRHAGRPLGVLVLDKGTTDSKAVLAAKSIEQHRRMGLASVVVVNYETAWRGAFAAWSLKTQWDIAICDEIHRIRGPQTAVSKYAAKLGQVAKYRLGLSGTPMCSGPLDLFAIFRFLDRGLFGTWFHYFRARYARCNHLFPSKVEEWLNQDELAARMGLLTYRVGAEVLDLPPESHHEMRVKLSAKAQKIYDGLQEEMIADIGDGVITATNALVKLVRLQQATSGHAIADDTEVAVEIDDSKRMALGEMLLDLPEREPVVVFCRFRWDLDQVKRVAEATGRRYGELSGRSKDGMTDLGTMRQDVDLLGVQIQAGGVGIDLTRACYAVYLSQTWSLGEYEQSLARLNRPGQTRPVHYYHCIASGTVDEAVYGALRNRKDVVEAVLDSMVSSQARELSHAEK